VTSPGGEALGAEVGGRVVGCVTFVDGLKALSEVDDPGATTARMLGVATEERVAVSEALIWSASTRPSIPTEACRLDTRNSMASAQRSTSGLCFRRDPGHDWAPAPGILLLDYVLDL